MINETYQPNAIRCTSHIHGWRFWVNAKTPNNKWPGGGYLVFASPPHNKDKERSWVKGDAGIFDWSGSTDAAESNTKRGYWIEITPAEAIERISVYSPSPSVTLTRLFSSFEVPESCEF